MDNSEAKIQCSNPNCQSPNFQSNKICSRCGIPIVKRYLRPIGEGVEAYGIGTLLFDRYLTIAPQIVLDTKPGLSPQIPEDIPPNVLTYLQLYPYRLHLPQIYGQLSNENTSPGSETWLLEYSSLPTNEKGELKYSQLIPELREVWRRASSLRQLNWLWQIARLWYPLHSKGVASSLLDPSLLRVNDSIVQLLELKSDRDESPKLAQLGRFWSQSIATASPEIKDFLEQLCFRLENREITKKEQLIASLEKAIEQHRRSYQFYYQIYTSSDAGPSRKHNEDACYPDTDRLLEIIAPENPLVIVCDGIGGHDGGEIASEQAIQTLKTSVTQIKFDDRERNPIETQKKLVELTKAANDAICDRNDSEQRQERQRMGTTLVMALANYQELYLTHVGDSRIYLINASGCHQLTVDDDLASREVRMGYALYRDAVQYPSAGALVQALGMRESQNLHPNVQRFIWDEDCILLLCSDGLSDFDRVEQYWKNAILPGLGSQNTLDRIAKDLIKIANEKNGHDNVTVGLIHCQISSPTIGQARSLSWAEVEAATLDYKSWSEGDEVKSPVPTVKISEQPTVKLSEESSTEILSTPETLFPNPEGLFPTRQQSVKAQRQKKRNQIFLGIVGVLICLALGAVAYLLFLYQQKPRQIQQEIQERELSQPQEEIPNSQPESSSLEQPPLESMPSNTEQQIPPEKDKTPSL
jgi:protein phosphatase